MWYHSDMDQDTGQKALERSQEKQNTLL
jgi:hypothetical protein